MADIIGIGALNVDKLYLVERIGAAGEEIGINSVSEQPGGSAANTIAALTRLGIKTGFIGRVGDDADGAYLRSELVKEGVDTRGIEVARGRTGSAIVLVDPGGERSMYVHPGVNDVLSLTPENISYAKNAKYLHLSSFVGETVIDVQREILDRSKAEISFAPGMLYARRGVDTLRKIISNARVVFLNRDEIEMLTGSGYSEGAGELNDIGAEIVVVTLGGDGCYIRTSDAEISIPGLAARVVDTTGAGDAFCAGFLYGLLIDKPLSVCGRLGNFVAAKCIEAVGAREGLPRKIEIVEG
uniref:ADP-dependent ribose-1-phosphate kinase n=1 Tax=Candidatus Methanogaster sp. ANME-2c ERB4 TaxID=2759911 RepID=A0A7G9YMG7_9EURY|nr:carbohydrate kinase [uncultured archaeon GZfos17F1]QNO49201.1 ADP-dependent ribose-1-phosphate kinase [Methanosarcinales archaeon ANME-2c ERB4]